MTCHNCRTECARFGRHRNGLQRYRCGQCRKTFTEPHERPLEDMRIPLDKAEAVLKLMVEGMSVRSIERFTDVHRDTILSLLVLVGEKCERLSTEKIRNVPVNDVQCDEIWAFIQKKEGNKWPHEYNITTIGDAYTYVAIERDSKLILAWHLGRRGRLDCEDFISKLRWATADSRFQLTTDGFQPYIHAIDNGLHDRADYAQLVKVYAAEREGEARYSPPEVVDTISMPIFGEPDPGRICTSHVERQNLTMRMQMRRLTRLTNGFSKKWENLKAMLALYFAWYNFVRVHRTLRVTPAMEAGIADHVWEIKGKR